MKEKLVSVIIPVYNAEKYINSCIVSVLNQTYKNLEIIVVNDGSKDNSEEEILKIKDDRIKYFYKDNSGCGATRNFGIDKARGEFIYFIDSDDYIDKTMIEKLVNSIKDKDSFVGILGFYYDIDGRLKLQKMEEEEHRTLKSPSVCTRMFRKEILDKSGIRFSGLKIGEDLEFVFKVLAFNNHSTYIDEALYYYRLHEESLTHDNSIDRLCILKAIESIEKYLKESNKYEEFKELIEFITISHIYFAVINLKKNEKFDEMKEAIRYLLDKYPNWENNSNLIYFKDQSIALKELIKV